MIYQKITLNEERNVTLTCYCLDSSVELSNAKKRPAILVLPGGGYRMCSNRESEPIAMAYLAEGYNAFVLHYSVAEHSDWPNPLDDVEQAMTLIKEHAEEWGIETDKIATIGFSAGGHLAAASGMLGKNKPNAMILCYPAILGSLLERLDSKFPGLEDKATEDTPPAFIFATRDDALVSVKNAIALMDEFDRVGLPFESHIFGNGQHGMSLGRAYTCGGYKPYYSPAVAEWFGLSMTWLKGIFGEFVHDEELPAWE